VDVQGLCIHEYCRKFDDLMVLELWFVASTLVIDNNEIIRASVRNYRDASGVVTIIIATLD